MNFLRRPVGSLAAVVAVTMLVACSNPWADDKPTANQIYASGWVGPPSPPSPPKVYCYRTLADAECHAAPLPDGGTRLVGYDGGWPGINGGLAPTQAEPANNP